MDSGPKRKPDRAPTRMAKKGKRERFARVDDRNEGNTVLMTRFKQKKTMNCWRIPIIWNYGKKKFHPIVLFPKDL